MPKRLTPMSPEVAGMPLRITRFREERDLSMGQLELAANLPRGAVSRWERGERLAGISADMVVRLSHALGCTIGELFGEHPIQIAPGALAWRRARAAVKRESELVRKPTRGAK